MLSFFHKSFFSKVKVSTKKTANEDNSIILKYAAKGDLAMVAELLNKNVNPWVETITLTEPQTTTSILKNDDRDLLFWAYIRNWEDIAVNLLRQQPSRINKIYNHSLVGANTLLTIAWFNKNVMLAHALLDFSPNFINTDTDVTPLMLSVVTGDLNLTARIFKLKPADINFKSTSDYSALSYAISQPQIDPEMVRFLIANGANPLIYNHSEEALPTLLMQHGAIELCKDLIEKYPNMLEMCSGKAYKATLLHIAASTSYEMTRYIYHRRPEFLNMYDEEYSIGWTALMYAAWHGQLDIVKFLINKDADINCKSLNREHILNLWCYLDVTNPEHYICNDLHSCSSGQMPVKELLAKYCQTLLNMLYNRADHIPRDTALFLAIMADDMTAKNTAKNKDYKQIIMILSESMVNSPETRALHKKYQPTLEI
jgi:hypothetical protein